MFKRLIDRYLGPRPKKVNCWYCGQDSYLLPGSGQTPRQFYCNLCENTNSRDETGEIQDPVPTQSQSSNGGQEYCVKTTLQVSSKEFCENCIADQRMNRMYLNQYIPDENDPSFKSRWDSAKTYEQYLDEKTPLCKDCQIKVDKFNAAQETRLPKKIDIKDTVSQDTTSFRLLDESQKAALIYFLSKCLWVTAHILAVIFNFYGYCYPPRSVQTSDVEDISVMASKGDNDSLDMLKLVVKNMLSKLPNLIGCLISCQDNKKNCALTSDCTIFYYTLNTLSIFVLYWHPIVSLEYENDNPKAKHYDVYKVS
ncbi:hypothetical protein K501DRAFT_337714 [Backusella circina FSU 941]|nr:hypothetical protein K501DRAFT_337714 [Backusella circina FSU 941]